MSDSSEYEDEDTEVKVRPCRRRGGSCGTAFTHLPPHLLYPFAWHSTTQPGRHRALRCSLRAPVQVQVQVPVPVPVRVPAAQPRWSEPTLTLTLTLTLPLTLPLTLSPRSP